MKEINKIEFSISVERYRLDVLRRFMASGERVEPRAESMRCFVTSENSLLHRRNSYAFFRAGSHHDHFLFDDCILPLERSAGHHLEFERKLNGGLHPLPRS